MGSIASTLNSINSSLLSEINSDLSASGVTASTTTNSNSSSAAAGSSSDSVNTSQIGQLFQELQQLETSNPADFQKVTADAASQFQQAAQQATDPAQASFLSNLADKFQQASQSGNLSAFENGVPRAGSEHHHGHHHHGGDSSTDGAGSQDSTVSQDSTSLLTAPSSSAQSTGSTTQSPATSLS